MQSLLYPYSLDAPPSHVPYSRGSIQRTASHHPTDHDNLNYPSLRRSFPDTCASPRLHKNPKPTSRPSTKPAIDPLFCVSPPLAATGAVLAAVGVVAPPPKVKVGAGWLNVLLAVMVVVAVGAVVADPSSVAVGSSVAVDSGGGVALAPAGVGVAVVLLLVVVELTRVDVDEVEEEGVVVVVVEEEVRNRLVRVSGLLPPSSVRVLVEMLRPPLSRQTRPMTQQPEVGLQRVPGRQPPRPMPQQV